MSLLSNRIAMLIRKHLQGDLTPEETAELHNWLDESGQNQQLFDRLTREDTLWEEMREYTEAGQHIWNKINRRIAEEKQVIELQRRKRWKYIAAAVTVLAVITSGIYFWPESRSSKPVAQNHAANKSLTLNDIKAGGNRATLKLSDGSVIALDTMQSGTLATQEGVSIIKLKDGQVVYDNLNQTGGPKKPGASSYNTLSTPRGGQHYVVLSDGTDVWLNASSSISYPVVFTENERTVSITGEAYFEVKTLLSSRGKEKVPFKVKILSASGKQTGEVEVLGTHFNINAYNDEASVKTNLLEGSVKVTPYSIGEDGPGKKLKPGQQMEMINNQLSLIINPDLEQVMSWRNGLFQFKSAGIETIMREVSRWYDIDVVYQKKPTDRFSGKISRDMSLADFLKVLQYSEVKFTLEEGRKLVLR